MPLRICRRVPSIRASPREVGAAYFVADFFQPAGRIIPPHHSSGGRDAKAGSVRFGADVRRRWRRGPRIAGWPISRVIPPARDKSRIRTMADGALQLGALGQGRRARHAQPDYTGKASTSGSARERWSGRIARIECRDRKGSGRSLPGGVGHGHGHLVGSHRSHRLSVHPWRRHDAPGFVRARVLQRQDVERVSGRGAGHQRGRRRQELDLDDEERHRHPWRAVRHSQVEGGAVSRARYTDLRGGSGSLGAEGRSESDGWRRAAPALGPVDAPVGTWPLADQRGDGRPRQLRDPVAQETRCRHTRMGDARLRASSAWRSAA